MKDLLEQEMKHHNRDKVVELLKDGALEQVSEEEQQFYCELMALRDKRIVTILSKRLSVFDVSMLKMDLNNWNNREYISFVLDKYHSKFNWEDEDVCEEMFAIACKVENKKILRFLIEQKKVVSQYPMLMSGSDSVFKMISKIKLDELDNDLIVEMIVQAATSGKAEERLLTLQRKGVNIATRNEEEKTASEVLEARIQDTRYSKNRSGALKRKQDQAALQYLVRVEKGLIVEEEKTISKKIIVLIGICVLALIVGGTVAIIKYNSADNDEVEESLEDTADESVDYNTDTSLIVEDGDTVNIDYTGYIDGVAFDGGSTDGVGTSLTIGSGSYIDDFEEQLIGHSVGETVTVSVTFPEDYGNEELNGKDAEFEVVINGIYE